MTAREVIDRTAAQHGWARTGTDRQAGYVRGALCLTVSYDARGGITGGAVGTSGRPLPARGRREHVLSLLTRWQA